MTDQLQRFVETQAIRTISKYQLSLYRRKRDASRREKRTGKKSKSVQGVPIRWELDQQFNPFYVRGRAASLSHAIEAAIKAKSYKPRASIDVSIAKEGGGVRRISIYTVPDAAVGTWLRSRLHSRNSALLSEFAFAYRPDKNANDAIVHIAEGVVGSSRIFVVEYDFERFFDSIDHSYLIRVLRKHFQVRSDEFAAIRALLSGESADGQKYQNGSFVKRTAGIPQGNTISLFLANAVCYELDQRLQGLGIRFARYADDVVVVTGSYLKACRAADSILQWSSESKVKINSKKSDGISLLISDGPAEIKSKSSITFLGCEISSRGIAPSSKRIERLKAKLSRVVYQHLVQAPNKRTFNKRRVRPEVDWDLVTCINEIRKILYGRLTEADLTAGLDGSQPLRQVRSHVAGWALVDTPDRFREVDGWLVGVIERAYRLRRSLLVKIGAKGLRLTRRRIIQGDWYKFRDFQQETRLPSLFRVWLYTRKFYKTRGVRALAPPAYDYED